MHGLYNVWMHVFSKPLYLVMTNTEIIASNVVYKYSVITVLATYCTAQNFDGENIDEFDEFLARFA